MADNQIATLISRPVVTFYTQEGTFPLVARDSNGAFPGDAYAGLNEGLLSFQIKNDASQDLPSADLSCFSCFFCTLISCCSCCRSTSCCCRDPSFQSFSFSRAWSGEAFSSRC